MTFKIQLEMLGPIGADGFAKLIEQRIATLREYDDHEATVRKHDADLEMKPEDRWVSLAVPAAPLEIDGSIKRTPAADGRTDFTPDYEIVGPSFAVRKSRLFDAVSVAEREAIAAVAPAGKLRAYQFRLTDIHEADAARIAALGADRDGIKDYGRYNDDNRPMPDTRFLAEQVSREQRRQHIYRWAANLHSDIEDLTEATIDAFAVTPFNG